MPGMLYALLVGIDKYEGCKPLDGCVNDIESFEQFLRERTTPADRLKLVCLLDREATREQIIATFRAHLGQAGEGDTALFYFAGHGSREIAPAPYDAEEPGGRSETIVAWDSRQRGGCDLADKELAVLIAEVAAGGPHVVVFLDSCYSGTATRGESIRTAPGLPKRPAGTYFFENREQVPAGLVPAGGWMVLPRGRHVLLAACGDDQTAKELPDEQGTPRGVFSHQLLITLERLGLGLTYRELIGQVRSRVGTAVTNQTPQSEGELDLLVFDGGRAARPAAFHLQKQATGWALDAGLLHGLGPGAELEVFPAGATELRDPARRLATVRLTAAGPARSATETVDGELPEDAVALPAILTHLPFAPLRVAGEQLGELAGALRQAKSPFLQWVEDTATAAALVSRRSGGLVVRHLAVGSDLPVEESAEQIVQALERIARWHTLAQLENSHAAGVPQVEMTLLGWHALVPATAGQQVGVPLPSEGEVVLPYRGAEPGRFTVQITNHGQSTAWIALFDLTESFEIRHLRGGGERLQPGEVITLRKVDGFPAYVPSGLTRRRDLLILIASEEPFDSSLLEQEALSSPWRQRPAGRPVGVIEALLWQVAHRELEDPGGRPVWAHPWGLWKRAIVGVRESG
jgi:hypothetical protein